MGDDADSGGDVLFFSSKAARCLDSTAPFLNCRLKKVNSFEECFPTWGLPSGCTTRKFGTMGLWVSWPHDWSVLASDSPFSYMHDIGDMRPCHGISAFWPWFGMAFGPWHLAGHLPDICDLPTACYLLFIRFHSCGAIPFGCLFVCPARPHLYTYLALQVCAKSMGVW